MNYDNATKNQHFISQVEQRLNSTLANQNKIYSFSLIDRESCHIELDSEKGAGIPNNLSFSDLYTFKFFDDGNRKNFESFFGEYEQNIQTSTQSFLDKIKLNDANVIEELNNILLLKFLNFIRNPYNIKKVINNFGVLADHYPTNEGLLREYKLLNERMDGGLERICRVFDVTREDYYKWMRIIFLSLINISSRETMLENLIMSFISNKNYATAVWVYSIPENHSDKRVSLSDRAFVDLSDPGRNNLCFAFNLNSKSFIKFALLDIEKQLDDIAPLGMNKNQILKSYLRLDKTISIRMIDDDKEVLAALKNYNINAVYQCHDKVFCAVPLIYGV